MNETTLQEKYLKELFIKVRKDLITYTKNRKSNIEKLNEIRDTVYRKYRIRINEENYVHVFRRQIPHETGLRFAYGLNYIAGMNNEERINKCRARYEELRQQLKVFKN